MVLAPQDIKNVPPAHPDVADTPRRKLNAIMTDLYQSLDIAAFCREDYYNYTLPARWIKVLKLCPGSGSHLSYSLMSRIFGDIVLKYNALSYVWGSDAVENKVKIECNGSILSIGSNLACALTLVGM